MPVVPPPPLRARRAAAVAALAVAIVGALVGAGSAPAAALPSASLSAAAGGAGYVAPSDSGGASVGVSIGTLDARPIAALLAVAPRRLRTGAMPVVRFRLRQRGVASVAAQVRVYRAATRTSARRLKLDVRLGRVAIGHTKTVVWPRSAKLAAGRYVVSLHATDPTGRTLARQPRRRGQATLTVVAPPRPKPRPAPTPTPAPVPVPVVPTVPIGPGVFPVVGSYTFGGSDARFGAGRKGHIHQGQDVVAPAGESVIAPEAGTVIAVDLQKGGAGYYVTLHANSGRDFFFAHLEKGSTVVTVGQSVAVGTELGRVGATGDATGPHLHFEIWEGGWGRGHPIDPLPQLKAWAGEAP